MLPVYKRRFVSPIPISLKKSAKGFSPIYKGYTRGWAFWEKAKKK